MKTVFGYVIAIAVGIILGHAIKMAIDYFTYHPTFPF